MLGNRALYHDGWVAGCLHGRLPWLTSGGASFDNDTWELYNIEKDFSQANDLAAKEPAKLRDSQLMFPLAVGSPDEVASKINASFAKVRTTHLVLGMHLPGLAPERSRSSMELFSREVAPQLKPLSAA